MTKNIEEKAIKEFLEFSKSPLKNREKKKNKKKNIKNKIL